MSNLIIDQHLTGNYYFKKTWFGMVLMVEVIESVMTYCAYPDFHEFKKYVKATEWHISQLDIKTTTHERNKATEGSN